jgi:hypothetical protein
MKKPLKIFYVNRRRYWDTSTSKMTGLTEMKI